MTPGRSAASPAACSEQLGFAAEEATNGHEALEVCRQHMPDMVLLDRNMPGLDGIGCVRALRALPGGTGRR